MKTDAVINGVLEAVIKWIDGACMVCPRIDACLNGAECDMMWNVADTDIVDLAPLLRRVHDYAHAGSPRPLVPSSEALEEAIETIMISATNSDTGAVHDHDAVDVAIYLRAVKDRNDDV